MSDLTVRFQQELQQGVALEDPDRKIRVLYHWLIEMCEERIADRRIQFNTHFALLAYVGHQFQLSGRLLYNAHQFRMQVEKDAIEPQMQDIAFRVCADFLRLLYQPTFSPSFLENIPSEDVLCQPSGERTFFRSQAKALILAGDAPNGTLSVNLYEYPEELITVKYRESNQNDAFSVVIDWYLEQGLLPLVATLVDMERDHEGAFVPKAIVLEPDYLMDITSIAECFSKYATTTASYLARKFLPRETKLPLLIGNVANFFLDQLMAESTASFNFLLKKVFQLDPLGFALLSDAEARDFVQSIRAHYTHLSHVVRHSLDSFGIEAKDCYLEPSFCSAQYGIQGRLDVLYDDPRRSDDASIIELKSGSPYQPNTYGLSASHYVQTLLYDLLIKSASAGKLKPTNYILYSKLEQDGLRFAPAVRSIQLEALAMRNELIMMDRQFSMLDQRPSAPDPFLSIGKGFQRLSGFVARNLERVMDGYRQLNELERKYFLSCVAFVSREHRLAKIGVEGSNLNNGQAALWLNSAKEKETQYNILSGLRLIENNSDSTEPILIFRREEETNQLANFRRGDLVVLYPFDRAEYPLENQLFKGTIILLDHEQVAVRLRARQFNDRMFVRYHRWNLEHDSLDSSFSALLRSIFQFALHPSEKRRRFLTLQAPTQPGGQLSSAPIVQGMTAEQNRIFQKILQAPDYFLLWGPPGTGKTSIILRHVVQHLLENTREIILILAYTNRAVDEICRALSQISPDIGKTYFRVGSRYSTADEFRPQLLRSKIEKVNTRTDLLALLRSHRLVVGTTSSFLGQPSLLNILRFDRIIVDEATQILEPTMAGLLPHFAKKLLIGDHRQLSAVVVQPSYQSMVKEPMLRALGLESMANSYFERLYKRCQEEGWSWAYDRLGQQGRMHYELMDFPSNYFYDGSLEILPSLARQTEPLPYQATVKQVRHGMALGRRVSFLSVKTDSFHSSKANVPEANVVNELIQNLHEICPNHWSIGVITPFRAQIALIKTKLEEPSQSFNRAISVDTVERYQGGSRDVIIVSLCITHASQLATIINRSSEGIDRKLNVALTRAKEQIIVIGNPAILCKDPTYRDFIAAYQID